MSTEDGFLRAIQSAPADATAKLVYADWLDDRGEHEKAEYLRLITSIGPQRKATQEQSRRIYELQYRFQAWVDLVRGSTWLWDSTTLLALGRLQGSLASYATLSGHESDITYDFHASLDPRTGSVAEMAPHHYGVVYTPVTLTPMAVWEVDLRRILTEWLLMELGRLRNGDHFRLSFLSDDGRDGPGLELLARIREVIIPTAGWHVQITRNQFYA